MNIDKMSNKDKYPYVHDSQLLQRVRQYVDNFEDPGAIDHDSMTEDLRLKYKEYGRRQKSAFRGMVKRAYRIVMENRNENSSVTDEVDDDDDESDVEVENFENNDEYDPVEISKDTPTIMSVTGSSPYFNSIQKVFTKQNCGKQESINISSDEETKTPPATNHKIHPTPRSRKRKPNFIAQIANLPNINVTEVSIKRQAPPIDTVPQPKRPKIKGSLVTNVSVPSITFASFAGFPQVLKSIKKLVSHLKEPEIYKDLGVTPPRGFLLHGPPGCGKTLLAKAVAGELKVPLVRVSGTELITGISGESESRIRELFEIAEATAPCILFIDEIDAISPPREAARKEMERRIVSQLLTCIDGLEESEAGSKVVLIGATNYPDVLDPALRRAGRFDREVCLGIPDRAARKQILKSLTVGVKLHPDIDLETLAAASPGYVGADLKALLSQAAIDAVDRVLSQQESTLAVSNSIITDDDTVAIKSAASASSPPSEEVDENDLMKFDVSLLTKDQREDVFIEMGDIMEAFKSVQPSAKREGFATVPDVTWDNIGSLKDIRNELQKSFTMPVKYQKEFEELGLTAPSGILLCGPPGCGKTLLAKAVANEANINFISVKGPELLNMYVGESERAVRQCFQRAKNSQPCVIFFDEIDALCPRRSVISEGHNTRVVNQVLTEMDGVEGRGGVFLMAATNRPDMVDLAVLRPGRLDKILYVGLPSGEDRADILKALTKNGTKPRIQGVDFDEFGKDSLLDGFTGADLAALVKEASFITFTEFRNQTENEPKQLCVTLEILKQAATNIRPSVSSKDLKRYEEYRKTYGVPDK